jgi:UDP-N-acetylmuramate dehydrogenase
MDMPSAGSFFKRPGDAYAGALIEEAGLKGSSCGGAQVSEKHAGFIVNTGGAKAADVISLMGTVQDSVRRNSGYDLKPEPRIIGEPV